MLRRAEELLGGRTVRHLYLAFALAFAVTLFGFWPTTIGTFGPPDPIRVLHGLFAVTWMAMLVVQSWAIGRRRYTLHRRIGRSSLIVVPGLIITALIVVRDMLRPGSHFSPALMLTLAWIDLWSLLLFSLLYLFALVHRRNRFVHSRLMASTVFIALVPALGRVYGMNFPAIGGLAGALNPSFWTVEAILVGLIVNDGLNGRWRTPWWFTLSALAAIQLTMSAAPAWPGFVALTKAVAP